MSLVRGSMETVNPSHFDPKWIAGYVQESGFASLVDEDQIKQEISNVDQVVYKHHITNKVQSAITQGGGSFEVPSVAFLIEQISTPVYQIQMNTLLDSGDEDFAQSQGYNLRDLQNWGSDQAFTQTMRDGFIYGFNPSNGEGIMNAPDVTTSALLAADSYGETTLPEQNETELGQAFRSRINDLLARTFMSSGNVSIRLLMPQRVANTLWSKNVSLLDAQKTGAGTQTIFEYISDILAARQIELVIGLDDTLIGQGTAGADAVIMMMPKLKPTTGGGRYNTNGFAGRLQNRDMATFAMYLNGAAPIENPTPTRDGGVHTHRKWRMTSGWVTQPNAVTILSVVYE